FSLPSSDPERRLPQFGEDFADLVEKVLAIGALEGMDAGAVPALCPIIGDAGPTRQIDGLYTGEEIRIKEEWEGEPVPWRRVTNAVRRGAVQPSGHAVQHVADVADERARHWRGRNPARPRSHLQSAGFVLQQDGQQAVVGVFADAPQRRVPRRRVVEDA